MIDELQKSKYTQKDLALKFNVTQKTLSKYLKELQNNFPKNNSLFRYLGKRQYFLEKDVNISDDDKKRDFKKAVYYYELALEQSENRFSSAASNLGRIYNKGGYGIEKDERNCTRLSLVECTVLDSKT